MTYRIGFIGAGNMADAMADSIIKKELANSSSLFMSDPDDGRIAYMSEKYGLVRCSSNKELIEKAQIIILSVKPQIMADLLKETFLNNTIKVDERKLIISIAAGIPINKIEKIIYSGSEPNLPDFFPVIRVMPNTPSMAGEGMSGISSGSTASEKDLSIASEIMNSMGKSIILNEDKMDAVTAISGSGPAYFFYFIENLVNAATSLGFSKEESMDLVFQTAKGSIALMQKTGETPEELRKKVTSKGGTTEAALNNFAKSNLEKIVLESVLAARNRAQELSN